MGKSDLLRDQSGRCVGTRSRSVKKLDEMLELAPGTLAGSERLDTLGAWDSVSVVSFIALLDERFSTQVPASSISDCKTVDDLVGLAKDLLAD